MKKIFLLMALGAYTVTAWASPAELFKAGSFEFGGEMNMLYTPDYYIFDAEDREARKGNYWFFATGSGVIGYFPVDNLSVQFMPGIFYTRDVGSNGDSVWQHLGYLLELGTDYYLSPAFPWVFAPGLGVGLGLLPGLDRKSNGDVIKDDSFAVMYTVRPKLSAYYFLSDRIAPFISVASEFSNERLIRDTDGSSYVDDREFMKTWRLQGQVKIGMKYFLPAGARFFDTKTSFFNFLDL